MSKDERTESQPLETCSLFTHCNYIAHELANPLGAMLMSVDIIEKYFDADPRAREEVGDLPKILKGEIKRLVALLQQFRSFRIPSDAHLQPTSVAAEVREILSLQSVYYERRRIRIHQEIASDLPRILADPDKLRQVVLNLCNNAVEAMSDGGTLTIRTYVSEDWLCLEVADSGSGIPEGMRTFEPGVTNKPRGSGLGLLIVRELVEQQNGTVSYTTKPSNGTTFHLKFPILGPGLFTTAQPPRPQCLTS